MEAPHPFFQTQDPEELKIFKFGFPRVTISLSVVTSGYLDFLSKEKEVGKRFFPYDGVRVRGDQQIHLKSALPTGELYLSSWVCSVWSFDKNPPS